MSDGEDYMSDKFLAGLQETRPSLVNNRARKRQLELEAKQADQKKRESTSSSNINNERLQNFLSQPIPADNKGFQLLAKMGYKPGTGLGKQKDARTEPINISIKNNRSGLGREAVLAELTTKRHELRRAQLLAKAGIESSEEISVEAYRRRATQKAEERKQQYDVKHCQQTCESLDLAADVQEPELEFFWPPKLLANSSSELTDDTAKNKTDLEEQEEPSQEYNACEQLELLTTYLRTAYRFCYWCGTRYESTSDMEASCPGLKKDDH